MSYLEELAKALYQESQRLEIIKCSANWEHLTEGKDVWMSLAAKGCGMPNVPTSTENEIRIAGDNCSLTLNGKDVVSIVGDTARIKLPDGYKSIDLAKNATKQLLEMRDLVNGK